MELRHLRYFSALAAELHFGRAAARLGITQPPLSRQIQDLEREVGIPLLSRGRRGVALTDAGRRFLGEAQRTLEAADRAMNSARSSGESPVGQLVVGAAHSAQLAVLTEVLPRIRERRPGLQVSVQTLDNVRQATALRTGEIGVGLVLLPFGGRDLLVEPVVDEPMVLVLPRRHALAGRPRVALRDLGAETFFLYRRALGPEFHDFTSEVLRAKDGSHPPCVEVDGLPAALILVAAGLGVALLPAAARRLRMEGVAYKDLDREVRSGGIAVARRRERAAPELEEFLGAVHEAFPRRKAPAR